MYIFSKKYSNFKSHENLPIGTRAVPCRRTDMTRLIVAFRNFADEPKNWIILYSTTIFCLRQMEVLSQHYRFLGFDLFFFTTARHQFLHSLLEQPRFWNTFLRAFFSHSAFFLVREQISWRISPSFWSVLLCRLVKWLRTFRAKPSPASKLREPFYQWCSIRAQITHVWKPQN
jgi:hypothetical protein